MTSPAAQAYVPWPPPWPPFPATPPVWWVGPWPPVPSFGPPFASTPPDWWPIYAVDAFVPAGWPAVSGAGPPGATASDSFPQVPQQNATETTSNWTNAPVPTPTAPATVRTTAALVQGIIQTTPGVDVTPYIVAANTITTNVCTYQYNPYADGFVNSQMELIERWLAAHFYSVFDSPLVYAKAGTAAVRFGLKVDMGLNASVYGQTAMLLDTRGQLAKYNNAAKEKRRLKVGVWGPGCPSYRWGDYDFGWLLAPASVGQ